MQTNVMNYCVARSEAGTFRVSEADGPWAAGTGEYATVEAARHGVEKAVGRDLIDWIFDQDEDGNEIWTVQIFPR